MLYKTQSYRVNMFLKGSICTTGNPLGSYSVQASSKFCALIKQPFISVEHVQVISLVDCAHNERSKARDRV